jgi:hypothetical protein
MAVGALGHDDDEGPALGVVAELLGKAGLGLPQAFTAALASAMEKEDDGRRGFWLSSFGGGFEGLRAVKVFRQVDLKFVVDALELDGAVEKTGLLARDCGVALLGVGCSSGARGD